MSRVQTVVEAMVKAGRPRQHYKRSIRKGNLRFSPERRQHSTTDGLSFQLNSFVRDTDNIQLI